MIEILRETDLLDLLYKYQDENDINILPISFTFSKLIMKRAKELESRATWLVLYKDINSFDVPSKTFVYHQKIHDTRMKLQSISNIQKDFTNRTYFKRSKIELYKKGKRDWIVINVGRNAPLEQRTYSVVTIEKRNFVDLDSDLLDSDGHCQYQSISCSFHNKTTL